MRFIPTKIHGVLDYVVGMLLITAPWMFNYIDTVNLGSSPKNLVPIFIGVAVILYSLFTDYEWGVARKVPMSLHLILDFAGGALLAASPWLFGFSKEVYLPHLIIGILEMVAALTTSIHPGFRSQQNDDSSRAATAL